ncbi:MAG: hypothetical protein KDC35_08115 [Acidobacteria bacterium]|nr:hypothetical protein [Acidobacteriota bacterium]
MWFEELIHQRMQNRDGTPLASCGSCNRSLASHDLFVVAKAFDKGRCVLETAQCHVCLHSLQSYLSDQSRENLMLYRGKRFNAYMTDEAARQSYYQQDPTCIITGELITSQETFELYAVHTGEFQSDENYFFVGSIAIEQMSELLSEETRNHWQRFLNQLDPTGPEVIVPSFFG